MPSFISRVLIFSKIYRGALCALTPCQAQKLKKSPGKIGLKLQHCRTIVLLHWLPKSTARFPAKKRDILLPWLCCLGTTLTLPQSLYAWTYVRAYADVRTTFSRIDRLPNLLTNGAPLACYTAGSAINVDTEQNVKKGNLLVLCSEVGFTPLSKRTFLGRTRFIDT